MEFRISRKTEHKVIRSGLCRLYQAEAGELLRHLSAVPLEAGSGLLGHLGPHSYRGRDRYASSIRAAAGSLIKVIASSLCEPADYLWFTHALAQFLAVADAPWLHEVSRRFCKGSDKGEGGSWNAVVFWVVVRSALAQSEGTRSEKREEGPACDGADTRVRWPLLNCDEELRGEVIWLHHQMKKHHGNGFFEECRASIRSSIDRGYLGEATGLRDLRALEYLEVNLDGIENEFTLDDILEDSSIVAAVQIFDQWVHQKLRAAGVEFRLVLDRLTSTFRLVPPEACGRLNDPNHVEIRHIEARTVLSACLISYLTLSGIQGRIEEWVDAVGLIDRLGFADVLERFFRCPVCARWGYAVYTRRDYCSNKCRYRVWMKTPKGLEKRRKASAAWRKRYSDQVRDATPNIRRQKPRG